MSSPASVKIKIDDSKMRSIFNELRKLKTAYTLIGIQEGNPTVDGLLVSQIMFWNEYGTKNIPERSFMRGWFDSHLPAIKKIVQDLYEQVADGKITAEKAVKLLGQWGQDQLRKSILDFTTPPNAPATIRRKKSSHPLIDTGQALNSIHHTEHFNKPIPAVESVR